MLGVLKELWPIWGRDSMKLKYALWATLAWTLLACGGSGVGLWYITTHRIPGVSAEQRAAQLGQGAGPVTLIGYAAIWLPYAYQVGKKRREEKERQEERERA